MKDNSSPQAPVQLSNQEGSGLLDIRQMAETLKASDKEKQKRSLMDMSLPSTPAAPLGGALLLPVPKQRSPLALVGIIMGGTTAVSAVILGALFAAGVFSKTPPPPPPVQAVVAAQPVAQPVAAPVVEAPVAPPVASDPKKPTKGNTKKTAATKTGGTPTATPTPTPTPTPKKNAHKDELDELLGGK